MLDISLGNMILIVVNHLVLYIAMRKFLFKPVQDIIAKRQEEADKQFAEAAATKSEAEQLKTRYEQALADTEKEKKQILKDARKSADAEYKKIVDDAKTKATQVKKNAAREAEQQKAQILKKAEQDIADLVVDAAVKMVGEKNGADADHALYNKFLNKMQYQKIFFEFCLTL